MAQQGSRHPRSGRLPGSESSRASWPDQDDNEADGQQPYPPWAGPGVAPRWADGDQRGRRRREPPGPSRRDSGDGAAEGPGQPATRASRARARRTRRSRVIWGGAVALVLAVAAGAGGLLTLGSHPRPHAPSDGLVTTFLPGEFKTVPDACSAVTPSTLASYLPGKRRTVVPHSLLGKAESSCDWSVDAPPMYRLLEVTVQAYSPSGLATGDGSATFAAIDAYQQALQQKTSPPRKSLPKATVSRLPGLGDSAFAALQVPSAGGDTTDLLTVVARDHNVLVTVVFDGLARSRHGRYRGVSPAQLREGAVAAARDVLARLH